MASSLLTILAVVIAILAGIHQVYVKPVLRLFGVGLGVESLGIKDCVTIADVQACEKIVLHQSSGVLYLACSTLSSRTLWLPPLGRLNTTGSGSNYIATYDPRTSTISRLDVTDYKSDRGLSVLGMDVVPSTSNPDDLFLYLPNHRAPTDGKNAREVGADASIEIFRTFAGSRKMVHLATIEDPLIITPNDIVGSPDGKSFYFTNYYGSKVGATRAIYEYFKPASSVVYCHVDHGCKYAASNMFSNHGIAKAKNDTFYVANVMAGKVNILEKQADDTLVLTDVISTDQVVVNLSVDDDGVVWGAGIPKVLLTVKQSRDSSVLAPSSAFKFAANTGPAIFYGNKFKVEKIFEDDGTLVPGATTVVHDSQRSRLFFHGYASPWLTVCKYSTRQ